MSFGLILKNEKPNETLGFAWLIADYMVLPNTTRTYAVPQKYGRIVRQESSLLQLFSEQILHRTQVAPALSIGKELKWTSRLACAGLAFGFVFERR